MSDNTNESLRQSAKINKKGAKLAGKGTAKAAKSTYKLIPPQYRIPIVAGIIFLLLLVTLVGGTSLAQMDSVFYLSAQGDSTSMPAAEDTDDVIWDKNVAINQTKSLITIIAKLRYQSKQTTRDLIQRLLNEKGLDNEGMAYSLAQIDWGQEQKTMGETVGLEDATAEDNARYIYTRLLQSGYSKEAACGILGNIEQESSFDPSASNGAHYGICQWDGNRYNALKAYAKSKNQDPTTIALQVDFMINYELLTTHSSCGEALKKSGITLEEATDAFMRKYEACGDYEKELVKRLKKAEKWSCALTDEISTDEFETTMAASTKGDFDVLAAYSVCIGNAELYLNKNSIVMDYGSNGGADSSYTDTNGNPIAIYRTGKNRGRINYEYDLKTRLSLSGASYYKSPSIGEAQIFTDSDGVEHTYYKVTVRQVDIEQLAASLFGIDPNAAYINAENTTNSEVMRTLSDETEQLLYEEGAFDISSEWLNPLGENSYTITDWFGARISPAAGASTNHRGIDMAAPLGTPIISSTEGVVISSSYHSSFGNLVIVQYGEYEIYYAHLQKRLVSEGNTVTAGQVIGLMGSTGVSTGSHLHFQVMENSEAVDPCPFIGLTNGSNF